MRKLFYGLFLSSFGCSTAALASTVEAGAQQEDQDIRALKEWVDTKRQISLKEIGGDLSISGEVRTEFQNTWERKDGKNQRGVDPVRKLPARGFDVEVNLMFDYRSDKTWASIKLEFDNDAGVFSGTLNRISLERAYWGVRLIDKDATTFDIEAGRRLLLTVFDSKVQFSSNFDGILFRFDRSLEKTGDFYIHAGPFVVFDRKGHFGYVGEMGLLNICGTGLYGKLSVIDWHTKHYAQRFNDNRFRFFNTQITGGYRFKVEKIKKIGLLYSAFIINSAAKRLEISDRKRANWAFYAGLSMGQLLKQWDWAFDANYQIVLPQAIPDFDVSGIGLGNSDRAGFYTKSVRFLTFDKASKNTRKTARGPTNYRGFSIRFDVLLTDKLDWQQSYMQSITYDSDIGPFRTFKQYEMEFIYSW